MYGVANLLKEQQHFHKLLSDANIQQSSPWVVIKASDLVFPF